MQSVRRSPIQSLFWIPLLALGASVLPAQTQGKADTSSIRDKLIGTWSLASRQSTGPDGKVLSDPTLAKTPAGMLIYDRSGHVAAQLSRKNRTMDIFTQECNQAAQIKGRPDTAQTVLGYDAYFGTYTIDEATRTVTHHLDFAIFPDDIGKDIKRSFTLDGDVLTIRFNTTIQDGTHVTRVLVWHRLS